MHIILKQALHNMQIKIIHINQNLNNKLNQQQKLYTYRKIIIIFKKSLKKNNKIKIISINKLLLYQKKNYKQIILKKALYNMQIKIIPFNQHLNNKLNQQQKHYAKRKIIIIFKKFL